MQYAKKEGITLIPIPFWWDKSDASLAATIRHHRPDIAMLEHPTSALPISPEVPPEFRPEFKYQPNVSQEYTEDINPSGW
jgi:hypothetical protein